MSATIIDGKNIANEMLITLHKHVLNLTDNHNLIPGLAIILIGNDPASEIYVNNKTRTAEQIGISSFLNKLPNDINEKNLITKILSLNNDPKVHGIILQLPIPFHLNLHNIINIIKSEKDVDGFCNENIGKLVTNQDTHIAATARGCLKLIKSVKSDLSGLKAVIIGRSNLVGKPLAHLLLNEDCTVTIAHSKSINLSCELKAADIIIVAIGSPNFLRKEFVKNGSIIIDVGINRIENNKIVGDVDFESVKGKVSYITPVPGGVGPMTIACLLENTIVAAYNTKHIEYLNECQES